VEIDRARDAALEFDIPTATADAATSSGATTSTSSMSARRATAFRLAWAALEAASTFSVKSRLRTTIATRRARDLARRRA
jgi:hypothetical protein